MGGAGVTGPGEPTAGGCGAASGVREGPTHVVFSHGKESGPWGTKIRAMAGVAERLGLEVLSVDYRGMDEPARRVSRLISVCRGLDDPPLLVGSSMGGHVAAAASAEVAAAGLFLIAPAFYMPGYEALTPHPGSQPIRIIHGWSDEVVPVQNCIRWAREHDAELVIIPGDHRLTDALDRVVAVFEAFATGRLSG